MQNCYILDTSVLIHHPEIVYNLHSAKVIIPITVLSELDHLKTQMTEAGQSARIIIKLLDSLNLNSDKFKQLENSISIKIDISNTKHYLKNIKNTITGSEDDKIIGCALKYKKLFRNNKVILLSRDYNLRIRAKALNLFSENYDKSNKICNTTDLYLGFSEIKDPFLGEDLRDLKSLDLKECIEFNPDLENLYPNECVIIKNNADKNICFGIRNCDSINLIEGKDAWGVTSRNREQALALELLMNSNIELVTLIGKAGSGKTVLSLASALQLTLSQKKYERIIVYRPIQAVGNDLGYLPGSLEEKLGPWIEPIHEALDFITNLKGNSKKIIPWQDKLGTQYAEKITVQPLTYIRGRSIPNTFIIVDEAQNLNKHEAKTLLTRVSNGTKVVLTGDIEQIDSLKLDPTNNGLSYIIDKFKDQDIAGHLTLLKGERSRLATIASEIL